MRVDCVQYSLINNNSYLVPKEENEDKTNIYLEKKKLDILFKDFFVENDIPEVKKILSINN
jgi:hypothetical protein